VSDDPVDQINRFVLALGALIVMFVALVVVLLAWGASGGTIDKIGDFAGYLGDHDNREAKLMVTLGAVVVVLLMAMVMIVELTPSPLQKMRLRNVRAGEALLTTAEIAWRVEEEARAVEHVADCAAVVAVRGQRVDIALDLNVDAGADLARTADEACRRVHELVEEKMGVPLASPPRARMHYRELRLRDGGPGLPDGMRRSSTGWERPNRGEESNDDRGNSTDAPEEAQA
jgi:hypothetical protein